MIFRIIGLAVKAPTLFKTGATASALPAINGLTYDEVIVSSNISLSVVIRGTVYARRVPWSAAIEALSGLKQFIYSKSY